MSVPDLPSGSIDKKRRITSLVDSTDDGIMDAESQLPISRMTVDCHSLFEDILANIQQPDDFDAVETQLGRLNIWASNIGALAGGNSSLGYRLRLSPDIKSMVLRLLEVLNRNLRRIIKAQSEVANQDSTVDWSQIFTEAIEAASGSLDRLQNLAIVIRRSSAQSRNLRSQNFSGTGEIKFKEFVLTILKHRFKEANGSLCDQLAESIALRRKQFDYKIRHQKKLAFNTIRTVEDPSVTETEYRLAVSRINYQQNHPMEPIQLRSNPRHENIPATAAAAATSQTNASTLDSGAFRKLFREYKPPPSIVSKGTSIRDLKLEYPPPPALQPGQRECTCPYCCDILVWASIADEKWWKHHVDKDLEPYSCISEKCRSSPVQFVNFYDWVQHMDTHGPSNMAWNVHLQMFHCPICESLEPFRWKEKFMDHMNSDHAERFTQTQLVTLGRRSSVAFLREPYICPLCNCVPEEIGTITPQNRDTITELLPRHIAGHLKSLAFLALPYRDDINDCESETNRSQSEGKSSEKSCGISDASEDDWYWNTDEKVDSDTDKSEWAFLPLEPYNSEEDAVIRHLAAVQREKDPKNAPDLYQNNAGESMVQKHSRHIQDNDITGDASNTGLTLPPNTDTTNWIEYQRLVRDIMKKDKESQMMAVRIFSWVLCANRPLTLEELKHAIAIRLTFGKDALDTGLIPRTSEMIAAWEGLICVDEKTHLVSIPNSVIQDYFRETWEVLWGHLGLDEPRSLVAKSCVTYVTYTAFENGPCADNEELQAREQLYPLYSYAAKNWGSHIHQLLPSLECEIYFAGNWTSNAISSCVQMIMSTRAADSQDFPKHMTQFHLLAYFGLDWVLGEMVNGLSPADASRLLCAKDSYGRTPMIWAIINHHNDVVRRLISKVPMADLEVADELGRNPLSWAAGVGNNDGIELLVPKERIAIGEEYMPAIDIPDNSGRTPISWAAGNGHDTTVLLLLSKGANRLISDHEAITPAMWALRNGHIQISRILVQESQEWNPKIKPPVDQDQPDILVDVIQDQSIPAFSNKEQWPCWFWMRNPLKYIACFDIKTEDALFDKEHINLHFDSKELSPNVLQSWDTVWMHLWPREPLPNPRNRDELMLRFSQEFQKLQNAPVDPWEAWEKEVWESSGREKLYSCWFWNRDPAKYNTCASKRLDAVSVESHLLEHSSEAFPRYMDISGPTFAMESRWDEIWKALFPDDITPKIKNPDQKRLLMALRIATAVKAPAPTFLNEYNYKKWLAKEHKQYGDPEYQEKFTEGSSGPPELKIFDYSASQSEQTSWTAAISGTPFDFEKFFYVYIHGEQGFGGGALAIYTLDGLIRWYAKLRRRHRRPYIVLTKIRTDLRIDLLSGVHYNPPNPSKPTVVESSDVDKTFPQEDSVALLKALESDEEFRRCPARGCSYGQLHPERDSQPRIICTQCDTHHCYTCRVIWHLGETCAEYQTRSKNIKPSSTRSKTPPVQKPAPKPIKNQQVVEKYWQCHYCGTPYNFTHTVTCMSFGDTLDCFGHQCCGLCPRWTQTIKLQI